MSELWTSIFVQPILNLLLLLYQGFLVLHIPGALGWSITGLTIIVRLILFPLTKSQIESTKKLQELNPRVNELKQKHKSDKKRFEEERLRLYREHNLNPLAGCIPALAQIPVFFALYGIMGQVFQLDVAGAVAYLNKLAYPGIPHLTTLDTLFLGFSLAIKPSDWQKFGAGLLLVPLITGVTQLILSKMMAPSKTLSTKEIEGSKSTKDGEKESMEETLQATQSQIMYIFPIMIGVFAYQFPIGLALYWNAFTLFGIIQQYLIGGLGGLTDLLPKRK